MLCRGKHDIMAGKLGFNNSKSVRYFNRLPLLAVNNGFGR